MTASRTISALILLFIGSTSIAKPAPDVRQKVNEINQLSINNFGISLNALRYLAGAEPGTFIPLSYLQQDGQLDFIRELERAGYAKVTQRTGLPDGQEKAETFVMIKLIGDGPEIQKAIFWLQPNNSFKADGLRPRP